VSQVYQQDLTKAMAACIFLSIGAGLVLVASWFVELPGAVLVAALLVWVAGIVAVGVLTYRHGRRHGVGFWRALGKAMRQVLRLLWELFP
jgi:predicted lysophospholipase L1 biosynthesis ABC-type transport system permease subunit